MVEDPLPISLTLCLCAVSLALSGLRALAPLLEFRDDEYPAADERSTLPLDDIRWLLLPA